MKKVLSFLCLFLMTATLISCGANNSDSETGNLLSGNYYLASIEYSVYVAKFYDDNTIQIVDCGLGRDTDKRTSYYGSYSIDKGAVSINISDKTYSGAIIDDGNSVYLSDIEFKIVEESSLSEVTISAFSK